MAMEQFVEALRSAGIFEFYIPFIIFFAVLWGILSKIAIFGDTKQGPGRIVNLIISLFGALAIMVYTPAGVKLIEFISNLFGETLVVVLSLLTFVIIITVLGPLGLDDKSIKGIFGKRTLVIFFLGAIILAITIFISSGGTKFFPGIETNIRLPSIGNIDSDTLAVIVVVTLTALVIFFMARTDKGKDSGQGQGQQQGVYRLPG